MVQQVVKQLRVIPATTPKNNQVFEHVSLFDANGNPVTITDDQTGAEIILTGYVVAEETDDVSATDTINAGIGKVEYRLSVVEALGSLLTSYVVAETPAVLAVTDTLVEALGKIQATLSDLDSRVTTLEGT